MKTKIEWTEHVWNPVRGCSMAPGSEAGGCLNCYAARQAARNLPGMRSPTTGKPFAILRDSGPRWTGEVELIESKLDEPMCRRVPTTYFVNSMSDLFHEKLPTSDILSVFQTIGKCPLHKFIILTKREKRMFQFLNERHWRNLGYSPAMGGDHYVSLIPGDHRDGQSYKRDKDFLPNVILGVSCEDQATADERIPWLLKTPAACRMVSLEPLLGAIDLQNFLPGRISPGWTGRADEPCASSWGLDWVIVGGESGPGARPMHPDWVRSLRDQCRHVGVPFFFKQWGAHRPADFGTGTDPIDGEMVRVGKKAAGRLLDGRLWEEMTERLRVP